MSTRRRHSQPTALSAVALAVLLSGCGAPEADASSGLRRVTATLERFDRSGDRVALLRRREEAVVACMSDKFGLTYLPQPPDVVEDRPPANDALDYGLVDQFVGANETDSPQGDSVADPNEALVAAMSPVDADAWQLALFGTDREYRDQHPESLDARKVGCFNAASTEVLGADNAALLTELAGLGGEIATRGDADPAFRRAVAAHRDCLSSAGFTAPDSPSTDDVGFEPGPVLWQEAVRRFPVLASSPTDVVIAQMGSTANQAIDDLRGYERTMHAADTRCAERLRLATVRKAAHDRAATDVAAERASRIDDYRRMLDRVRDRARLAGGAKR